MQWMDDSNAKLEHLNHDLNYVAVISLAGCLVHPRKMARFCLHEERGTENAI